MPRDWWMPKPVQQPNGYIVRIKDKDNPASGKKIPYYVIANNAVDAVWMMEQRAYGEVIGKAEKVKRAAAAGECDCGSTQCVDIGEPPPVGETPGVRGIVK